MNVFDFIEMTKKEPEKWRKYCEIIIKNNGEIEIARPSHTERLIKLYCDKMNMSREEFKKVFPPCLHIINFICEKYGYICVWYDYLIRPNKINRFQKRTLKLLADAGLINIVIENIATEYSWYINATKIENVRPDLQEGL